MRVGRGERSKAKCGLRGRNWRRVFVGSEALRKTEESQRVLGGWLRGKVTRDSLTDY